ncbi:MAG: HEAT repeat domain-containing protein [Acidimicrobiia bacterium]
MDSESVLVASFLVLVALLVLLLVVAVVRKIAVFARDDRRTRADAAVRPALVALVGNDGDDAESLEVLLRARHAEGRAVERLAIEYLAKVRGEAHRALASVLERRGVVERMNRRARRHGPVGRARAAELLGAIGTPTAIDPLLELLCDRDAEVRSTAARALGRIGDPRVLPALLATQVSHRRVPRGVVTRAIAQVGGPAVDPLRSGLADPAAEVRALCAEMLGLLSAFGAVADLVEVLESDPETEVRLPAARSLGRLGVPSAVAALAAHVGRGVATPLRAVAAKALGGVGDPQAIGALVPLLTEDEYWVAHNAAYALLRLGPGGPAALRHVVATHPDRSAHAREALAVAEIAAERRHPERVRAHEVPA